MRSSKSNIAQSRPSRRTNHNIRPQPRHRTLRLELLENRQLLAVLDLSIHFRQDVSQTGANSVPGDEVPAVQTVEDPASFFPFSFWVEVRVQDRRVLPDTSPSAGVVSLPLNVVWEPGNVQTAADAVEYRGISPVAGPNPNSFSVQQDNPLLTPNFPLQRFVDDLGDDGQFRNLRGGAVPNADLGVEIGKDGLQWFSQMKFTADKSGRTCFSSGLAGSMSFADAAVLEAVNSEPACIEFTSVSSPELSSLSGFVYADADKDAVRDVDVNGAPIEVGLPKVEIELYRDGAFVKSDHTGPDGWYHFEDLTPGTYEIRQRTQPACFIDGTETLGIILPSGESRGTAGNDGFTGIELRAGEAGIDYNFGELGLKASCINKGMLLGSANLRQATVNEPLSVPSTVVRGTDQNDTFHVTIDTAAIRATVNDGAPQTFPFPEVQLVTIDALAGRDTIDVTGSSADETGHFQPDYFVYRHDVCYPEPSSGTRCDWDWALEVIRTENVAANAAAGRDLAVVRDSTGGDSLRAENNRATIGLSDEELELLAWERVRAISTRGGTDEATVVEPIDYELELLGDWI